MQLFRTEMLFLHPPQPVVSRPRYGHRRGTAPRYGHARMRPDEPPSLPVAPAEAPDRAPTPARDPVPDLERAA
ncbi:MAG: hypothetical protein ACTHOH_03410 [Lysobacteraceae bacterium]